MILASSKSSALLYRHLPFGYIKVRDDVREIFREVEFDNRSALLFRRTGETWGLKANVDLF